MLSFFTGKNEEVYFQKWICGQELTGSGTNFHLKLQQPLPSYTSLIKVYFQQQEAVFEKEDPTTFVAHFYDKKSCSFTTLLEDYFSFIELFQLGDLSYRSKLRSR